MSEFSTDFRALLAKHGIKHPAFAQGAGGFDGRVLYAGPMFDEEEMVAAVTAMCEGKWGVSGEHVYRFEREFSKVVKQAHTVAVNSGSSADLLMLAAAKNRFGWQDGDGVIVSPVGFPTSISAITLNGLVPVFVDIEWNTLNFDLDAIEKRLELPSTKELEQMIGDFDFKQDGIDTLVRCWHDPDQTKWARFGPPIRAILVSPVLGNPPDIDHLHEMAEVYDVKLLLDGCDSLGSTWGGTQLPEFFTASTCSFYPAHHVSTLNGGAISSDDEELIDIARSMSQWGRGCHCSGVANMSPNGVCGKRFSRWLPGVECDLDHRYVYTNVGYNVQQVDALAAMGLEQLKKLPLIHERRKAAYARVTELLARHIDGLEPVVSHAQAEVSWFGTPVLCETPELKRKLVAHLEARKVQTRSYFAGNLLAHPAYAHLGDASLYPNANEVLCRVFWLGASPLWEEAHFAHIEQALKDFQP